MTTFINTQVPRTIPGLQLWLDAADPATVVIVGGTVSSWLDKSGNKRNALEPSEGGPIYVPNALAGKGAIYTDGVTTFLFIPSTSNLEPGSGSYSMFFIIRYITTGLVGKIYKGNNGSTNVGYSWTSTSLRMRTTDGVNQSSGGGFNTRNFMVDPDIPPYVVSWIFTGSSMRTYNNGTLQSDGGYSGTVTSTETFRIGRSGGFVEQQTHEILMYNRELSESERLNIELYLANKWTANL